ncbi:NAD(P)H-binding protein [Enterococcus sp. AZ109]|uniref:NAD(P)H-binding protein n=1 Tax=Enterococcus sp. AZ109 TaxID=2774634 RepID=UPI003F2672B2
MILVTAAAGGVGRQVVAELAKRGLAIRAFDINPKVGELKELGVAETMVGDGRLVKDVKKALDGCDKVLYIPPMFIYDEAEIAIGLLMKQ